MSSPSKLTTEEKQQRQHLPALQPIRHGSIPSKVHLLPVSKLAAPHSQSKPSRVHSRQQYYARWLRYRIWRERYLLAQHPGRGNRRTKPFVRKLHRKRTTRDSDLEKVPNGECSASELASTRFHLASARRRFYLTKNRILVQLLNNSHVEHDGFGRHTANFRFQSQCRGGPADCYLRARTVGLLYTLYSRRS